MTARTAPPHYLEAFRDPQLAAVLRGRLQAAVARLGNRPVRIMEVCGTHTMAIGRYGLRGLLPPHIRLISGPGCPVCVTDAGYIDAALDLMNKGIVMATFGDMLRVPGSRESLADARARGGHVEICYSPSDAVEWSARHPDREVVFLAVGFETTAAPIAGAVEHARAVDARKVSFLTAIKRVPPALDALAADPALALDAFLLPAHVSAIIGADAYAAFAERHHRPCVIAGFEPLDLLHGLTALLERLADGAVGVDNLYTRVVRPEGNRAARALLERVFEPCDADWRGLGRVPDSGYRLRPAWRAYDAAEQWGVRIRPARIETGCRCGDVIKGVMQPTECPLFGDACTPESPIGPCMVSSEGSCAAYYRYGV